MPIEIRTRRLSLTAISADTALLVHDILSDPKTNTVGDGPHVSFEQTQAWAHRRDSIRGEHGLCWYLLTTLDTQELVGTCGIFPGHTGPDEPEIGYMTHHGHRQQGLASEAAQAVTTACHQSGVEVIWATVRPHNGPSLRVLGSCGFIRVRSDQDDKGTLLYLRSSQVARSGG